MARSPTNCPAQAKPFLRFFAKGKAFNHELKLSDSKPYGCGYSLVNSPALSQVGQDESDFGDEEIVTITAASLPSFSQALVNPES